MTTDAWRPDRDDTLGALGRTILPLDIGVGLPPVVALACYFDDSFEEPIHAGGGYLAEVSVWDQLFAPAWNGVISSAPYPISEFKPSDCRKGRGGFAPPWAEEERDQLTADLVSVMLAAPLYAGVSAAYFWPGKPAPPHRRSRGGASS